MVKSLSSKEVATSTVSLCKYGGRLHKHQCEKCDRFYLGSLSGNVQMSPNLSSVSKTLFYL